MSQFWINIIFVSLSFALYFGIAIWARAGSTKEFYVAGGGTLLLMVWQRLLTG